MKKLALLLVLLTVGLSANAQFTKKTKYISASFTGLDLSYSSDEDWTFGFSISGGYFFTDSWMLYGDLGYDHTRHTDDVTVGAGTRYYIIQNGLYLGVGLDYAHVTSNLNYIRICPQVGYAFFVNKNITIEPAVYYDISMNDFDDGSKVGLKIGLGFYF